VESSRFDVHEVPTHIQVEDRWAFGLTTRQAVYLVLAGVLAYGLYSELLPNVPYIMAREVRIEASVVAVVVLWATFAAFVVRPVLWRSLSAWIHFKQTPKTTTWQPARRRRIADEIEDDNPTDEEEEE
jgi:uncharacterized protein HemY